MRRSQYDDGRDAATRDGCDRLADFARKIEGPLLALAGAVLCLVAWAFLSPRGPQ